MRIGIVDLDTSHPESWIPIERDLGHEIVGVWDGGSVHPAGYAKEFAEKLGIPRVFASIEEMVPAVDCAIIHGCDWDSHVAKAWPFVEAGKSVLVDKPLAGNARDLKQLLKWSEAGARIAGGSSLRFAPESAEWLAKPVDERGTPDTVVCGCAVDEFNYGIHAYSLLASIMGAGATSVRYLGNGMQRRVEIKWPGGRSGIVIVGKTDNWLPFYASIATSMSYHQFVVDNSRIYRALLEASLPYLAGVVPTPPIAMADLIQPELWAIAARESWGNGDREVPLSEVPDDYGYGGAVFAAAYRAARYPGGG